MGKTRRTRPRGVTVRRAQIVEMKAQRARARRRCVIVCV